MPQRTKKEKVAAQQKRAFKYTLVESAPPVKVPSVREIKVEHHEITEEDISTKNYFFKDLKKSAIFIVAILGLEIFLHFARISNY